MKKSLIIGITSDIGTGIKKRLEDDDWQVLGTSSTYQSDSVFKLDLADPKQVELFANQLTQYKDWSLLCLFAGTMEPIGTFFDTDFSSWEKNFRINVLSQLKILQMLWEYRAKFTEVNVCFLAGGGTNSTFDNYSAYCLSKIALIKFVELIGSENTEGKFFIIGPGFMKTKIHNQTLRAGKKAGANFKKTEIFMENNGTTLDKLYQHIKWCMAQPRNAINGRNFSTVHDTWESGTDLSNLLVKDSELFKLRRVGFHNETI